MSKSKENSRAEAFKKYFHSSTDAQQKEVLQNEIEMDSFEKEALEGFNSLENNEQVLSAMQAIENKIADRTGLAKESKFQFPLWRTMGIAASVLFIALGAFTLSKFVEKNDKQLAVNSESSAEELESIVVEETMDIESSFDSFETMKDEAFIEQELLINSKESANQLAEEKLKREQKVNSPAVTSQTYSESEISELADNIAIDFSNDEALGESSTQGNKQYSQEERSVSTTSTIQNVSSVDKESNFTSDFALAKAKYNAGDYNAAIALFEKSASDSDLKNESNFYIGMSNFNLGKSNKAIKSFDAVISSSSPLKNNSKWFKSLVLLDKGQTSEAIKILNELANGNSSFKQQAIDKLKSLD